MRLTKDASEIGVKDDTAMGTLCAARALLFKAWRVVYLAHSYLQLRQYPQESCFACMFCLHVLQTAFCMFM